MAMARLDRLIAALVLALATLAGVAICVGAIWFVGVGRGLGLAAIALAMFGGPLTFGWWRFARGGLVTATVSGLAILALAVLIVRGVQGFLTFN
jgi:hypothetical protein